MKTKVLSESAEKWILDLLKSTDRIPEPIVIPKRKEKLLILFHNPDFIKDINRLRLSLGIPVNGFRKNELQRSINWAKKLYEHRKNKHKFEKQLKEIIKKFRVGNPWRQAIDYFLLYNDKNADHLIPYPVDIQQIFIDDEITLNLRICKDTEISDIERIWPEIKRNQIILGFPGNNQISEAKEDKILVLDRKTKKLWKVKDSPTKKFKSYKEFERHRKAYEMREAGKAYKEIANALKCPYSLVGTYIQRFKNAIKENELP